jgi:hypothetical protein
MPKRIIYPTDNGGVAIIIPMPNWLAQEGNTIELLALKDVPAGTYSGKVFFQDVSGTHADSFFPVTFTVEQGPTPTPKPTPSSSATKKPASDGCKGQIRN